MSLHVNQKTIGFDYRNAKTTVQLSISFRFHSLHNIQCVKFDLYFDIRHFWLN